MRVWSLITDTDNGLNVDLYLTEYQAYEALGRDFIKNDESALQRYTECLEVGTDMAQDWMKDYVEVHSDGDRFLITEHDHPWVFTEEA